jgi:hypothetical protein
MRMDILQPGLGLLTYKYLVNVYIYYYSWLLGFKIYAQVQVDPKLYFPGYQQTRVLMRDYPIESCFCSSYHRLFPNYSAGNIPTFPGFNHGTIQQQW